MRPRSAAVLLAILCAAVGLPQRTVGQIVFERDAIELNPPIDERSVAYAFRFVNTGSDDAMILDIKTSCSCIAPVLEKRRYKPGESGHIPVSFTSHLMNGRDEMTMKVTTDDGRGVQTIRLVANLRSYLSLRPDIIEWVAGEKREPKDFVVQAAQPNEIDVRNVSAVKGSKVAFAPVGDGSFRIRVEPITEGELHDILRLVVNINNVGSRVYEMPVVVR